jgi:hypothetical protein
MCVRMKNNQNGENIENADRGITLRKKIIK